MGKTAAQYLATKFPLIKVNLANACNLQLAVSIGIHLLGDECNIFVVKNKVP
jgi:hypothetical protein